MPGRAHVVVRGQPGSDRRAFHVSVTRVGAALRSTRSRVGITRPHWTLVQIRSAPEVILRASVRRESVQVQAGLVTVDRSRTSVRSRPAIGFGTDGVIAMSSGAHGPDGSASGTMSSVTWPPLAGWWPVPPVLVGVVGSDAGGVVAWEPASATCAAWSGPDDPSLEPPSSRAMPTTRSIAMPSTISRRTQ